MKGDITPTILSLLTNIKRKIIIEHIKEYYPLFVIGKDYMDAHMALQVTKNIRKKAYEFFETPKNKKI